MTEVELFPRGKTSARGSSSLVSKRKTGDEARVASSETKKGRKRKAIGSPLQAGRDQDKDWLFGAPKTKRAVTTERKSDGKGGDRQHGQRVTSGNVKAFFAAVKEKGLGMVTEQPGRPPRLENVLFKKLSKGTLILGVVFKVMKYEMVVSLPTGLTGFVHWEEVSDQFHFEAAAVRDDLHPDRNSSEREKHFGEWIDGRIPLTDLFHTGQVVRCAVIDVVKKGGNRRITLSLRASVVNKGLSMSQLSKGCGVCGSVASAEDHGYVVTLGLEGVTAFLPAKYAPEGGLKVGQPVETVIKAVRASAGTVTLSAEASLVASAVTSGTSFDLRSLKPGMLVDASVEHFLSNGIVVSFLGSFAGCVDHNNMPVVSGDEKNEKGGWGSLFKSGTSSVRTRMVMIDYANKAIRLTLRPHLVQMRPPAGLPPIGATLEGTVVRIDPAGLLLTVPSSDIDASETSGSNVLTSEVKRTHKAEGQGQDGVETDESGKTDVPESGGAVGAFVHISRVAEERVDDLDKLFKPGQNVSCRVTGSCLFEGWASATVNPSMVSSAMFRYEDLVLGVTVEGKVASVMTTGLVVKLGEGVQAWVPKMHMADVAVKNPMTRFKVGAGVKGRVLLVDAARKKASLTLKPSMVKDERPAIVSYKHAKKGAACTGFVIKVTRSYLHVGFYGNTFGVLSSEALALHGITDPTEAFALGQVIGCVVHSCDLSKKPSWLRLMLDVAGKTEEIGGAADEEKTFAIRKDPKFPDLQILDCTTLSALIQQKESPDGDEAAACPLSPGDVVSGTVAETQGVKGAIVIHLSSTPIPKSLPSSDNEGKKKPFHVGGILPYFHLVDHAALYNKTLVARLTPGTRIERLLVLSVDKHGVPTVSLKPLLISAVLDPSECGDAFMPREIFDVSFGDSVVGFVSELKSCGVFVSFLGGFTVLCPKEMMGGRPVKGHRAMLKGDSVRCVVRRVDERTRQVMVTFDQTRVPPSPALYIRSLLYETFATATGTGSVAADPCWQGLEFGSTMNAKVIGLKKYGVVLRKVDTKGRKSADAGGGNSPDKEGGRLMVCPPEQAMEGLEEGKEVKVRVLGVDLSKGVVDVTMDTDLVKAGRAKRRKTMAPLKPGDSVRVKLVLAKPNEKWAIAASREGRLFVLQVADFHSPFRTCKEAGLSTSDPEVKEFDAVVGGLFAPEVRGCWERMKDLSEGTNSRGNPYSDALMIVAEENGKRRKQKAPERKASGDSMDLGGDRDGDDSIVANPMESARVALDEIVKGNLVVCKVTAIKLERLEVEVAVSYPKTDGPETPKEESRGKKERRGGEESPPESSADVVNDDVKAEGGAGCSVDVKKTVRIRGRVHCTAAGLPGLDAPHTVEHGGDATQLSEWHPLEKYKVGEFLKARVLHTEDVSSTRAGGYLLRLVELAVVRRLGDVEEGECVSAVSDLVRWGKNPPKAGEVYRGVVKDVVDRGVIVWLSSNVEGFIPQKLVGGNVAETFQSVFRVGMGVRAVVRNANESRARVVLSLRGGSSVDELPGSGVSAKSKKVKRPMPGEIVEGTIDLKAEQWNPPSVMVKLDGGYPGRVCFTELEDEPNWHDDPLSGLKDGERFKFRVLENRSRGVTGRWAPRSELSLRKSRLVPTLDMEDAIRRAGPPEVLSLAKGYVENLRSGGNVVVRLDGDVSGWVRAKDLSDTFVTNPVEEFPRGRLVVCKVLAKDETRGKLWLTLRPSSVKERLSWKSKGLVKGLKVKGTIQVVKDFGVFIRLEDSKVHGLCHIEEVADHPIKDLDEVFHKGDRVTAVVLRIEPKKRRLSLGLKASYLKEGADRVDKGDTEEDYDDKDNSDGNGEGEAIDDSDGDHDEGEKKDDMQDSEDEERSSKRPRGMFEGGASGLGNAFSLDFGEPGSAVVKSGGGSGSDEDDGDSDDGGDGLGKTGHRSRKKAREKREEEERIAARERALQDNNATPETADDFERLLVASPNNSLLWVKYMAFKLSLADVEGARSVVERGLKAVSFRAEQERFNLWVSYMNLEHKFGSRTSLKAVFERACENSDPKKVYLHLAEVHGKAQETEQCEDVFQAAVKKFRDSHEVWMAFQLSRLKRGDDAGAREILQRSLQSLRRGIHVRVIMKYAQNEFEHGSIERGRLVFEGLLASYTKRVDIWNVYVAKEVKAGDIRAARNLHERLIRVQFKARRMKGIFKTYLQFEMNHGDEARVEAVKAKAKEYVMSLVE